MIKLEHERIHTVRRLHKTQLGAASVFIRSSVERALHNHRHLVWLCVLLSMEESHSAKSGSAISAQSWLQRFVYAASIWAK